ncbi:MAG: hypothetical protein U0X73_02805 [Thermoanaerobaculia bacterium]
MTERKYGHKGYRDDGKTAERAPRADPPVSRPAPPRERSEAPRGRGLGGPTQSVFRCARCGEPHPVAAALAAGARCKSCGVDLHACVHCAAFDSGAPNQCRRPDAPRVAKKDKENTCTLFEPRMRQESGGEEPPGRPADPRAAFDALFKR